MEILSAVKDALFLQDMVRFKIRVSLFEYKSRVKSQDTSNEAAVPHVSSEDSDSRRRSRDQEIRSSRDKTCLPNCDANVTESSFGAQIFRTRVLKHVYRCIG